MKAEMRPQSQPLTDDGELAHAINPNDQGQTDQTMDQILNTQAAIEPTTPTKHQFFDTVANARKFLTYAQKVGPEQIMAEHPERYQQALAMLLQGQKDPAAAVTTTMSLETKLQIAFSPADGYGYKLVDSWFGAFTIQKPNGMEPEVIRVGKIRRNLLLQKKIVVTERDAMPHEQHPRFDSIAELYTEPPHESYNESRHGHGTPPIQPGYEKVDRDTHWIIRVWDKGIVEEMRELAKAMANDFPGIEIEILEDFHPPKWE